MNIENLLSENPNLLPISLGVMAVLIISLGIIILQQQRKIRDLSQPKNGFLGKPLAAALAVLMIAGLLGGVYLTSAPESPDFQASADDVTFQVDFRCFGQVDRSNYSYNLNVKMLPTAQNLNLRDQDDIQLTIKYNANSIDEQTRILNVKVVDLVTVGVSVETQLEIGNNRVSITAAEIVSDGDEVKFELLSGIFQQSLTVPTADCPKPN